MAENAPRDDPSVSVIVPTYNRFDYLHEAVESVFDQTYDAWELLIIDDASTDGTGDWVTGLRDSRVKLIEHRRCGNPARLRNAGIAQAAGEYVAFLDSDDLWQPSKLETQLTELTAALECDWSYSDIGLIDANGADRSWPDSRSERWHPHSGWILDRLLVHEAIIACPSVVAKLELVTAVGGFDESLYFAEDYDLWLRFAARSPVCAVSEPLAKVRHHPGNNTRGRPEVNAAFAQVYAKFSEGQSDHAIRRLCNRQRAFYIVYLSNQLFINGSYKQGFRKLFAAFHLRPFFRRWWVVLFKSLVRPLWCRIRRS